VTAYEAESFDNSSGETDPCVKEPNSEACAKQEECEQDPDAEGCEKEDDDEQAEENLASIEISTDKNNPPYFLVTSLEKLEIEVDAKINYGFPMHSDAEEDALDHFVYY